MKKRPTIRDVADQAGLSVSTVSLVINNQGYVSDETRERVLRVVNDLSYHPTHSARGLASKTSGNIGFILSEDHFSQAEPFYTRIFLGTEFEARVRNYYILLTTVPRQFNRHRDVPRFLLERNVDGVIIAGMVSPKFIDYIENLGIPAVLVDYELKRKRASSVLIDNRAGAHAAVGHLLELGHKRIAFVGGDLKHPSIAERFQAYKETLEENDIPVDISIISAEENDTRVEDGVRAMEKLLSRGWKASAVFAANDAMAIGCIQCAKHSGLRIPDDVAVVGFDDIDISSHIEPPLTTVRVFKEEMGKLAVIRVVDIIDSKTRTVVTTHVPIELVVRQSTLAAMPTEPKTPGDVSVAILPN